jgi:hypothetical protein
MQLTKSTYPKLLEEQGMGKGDGDQIQKEYDEEREDKISKRAK